ncbi:PHD finger protein 20-like protein 1 [Rhinophrynus dorsalis]
MSKKPPSRPGITFEIGARLEAQDYLQKWYPSKIEKIDYEEGKMLIHFERWSSRYDEWIQWDSSRIRPLERPALRKEIYKDDEENYLGGAVEDTWMSTSGPSLNKRSNEIDFKEGEEVLARWTDCRYYPAKIETINKEGTYTVQFYDGVIRCLKKMHIKSMPEDAKGQDWIALVKAATAAAAAAKNKSGNKPRTSVNSNKDKEEKKWYKGSLKKEEPLMCKPMDIFHKEEEQPTSSRSLEVALEDAPKMCPQSRDDELLLKRKISQVSSFQAKRARLNKITGLLASKAGVLDDAEKKEHVTEKTSRLEEEISPKPPSQKQNEADISRSCITLKPSLFLTALSSGKARCKKEKRDPGDASGCKKLPMSPIAPDFTQGENLTLLPHLPSLAMNGLPDVTYMAAEKLEPLDLSCSADLTSRLVSESSFHIDCPSKEKENIEMITYSSKALADGRIASTSSAPLSLVHALHVEMTLPNSTKTAKGSKKKRSPVSISSEVKETLLPAVGLDKLSDNVQEKVIKKVNEKDKRSEVGVVKSEKKVKTQEKTSSLGKKKDKDKDRKEKKEKEHSKSKQKKKKKKKKKSKHGEYSNYEDCSLNVIDRCTSPVTRVASSNVAVWNTLMVNTSFQFPRAILSVDLTGENLSDMEFLEDSSTESLILSGDEYNQEFDSTNFDESQDEEEAINEIVRCVCEMDEENGFMIQCEECLCWQHSACMGLLEDSIPEQYICYVCSDPPGQRWSAKYRYDKDWFNNGRMCGLSFINENYTYLNAKKIVSTHHLLADIYGVTEILHGLQLKFGILKNKEHPDLHLWACPGIQREHDGLNEKKTIVSSDAVNQFERTGCGKNHKVPHNALRKMEETYITSEHSYQKPQSSEHGCKSSNDLASSDDDIGMCLETKKSGIHLDTKKCLQSSEKMERRTEQNLAEENTEQICNERRGTEEQGESNLQWQLNLLTHIENVQNEVTSRMDLIEKEVDVLESWLDFTGELEPPDPLARLPQLKRRIKQLLTDMGKVQQIATLCSV